MITHIVSWRVKESAEGLSKAEILKKMKADLEALIGVIPAILHLRVGINQKPSDAASDIVLLSSFASWEDLAAYAADPAHQGVVEFVGKVVEERRVVDFESV